MAEKRTSSSAGFENPQVPKKPDNFKVPEPELTQFLRCCFCNKTMIITEKDMRVHVSTCTGDKEVMEVENVRTQETVMKEPVSKETGTGSSYQSKGRFSRIDSSTSGTGSPSSSLARSTSLSGASERSSETPLTQDRAHTPRAQSTGTSTSGIGTCTYTPSASGISSSSV